MRLIRAVIAALAIFAAAAAVASQVFGGPLTYVIVSGHSMEPALHTGDLGFVLRQSSYRRGDVVAFRVPAGEPGAGGLVIHRVTGGTARTGYRTQGDNREGSDPWRPKQDDVIGKLAFDVPRAGLAPAFLGSPLGLGLAAALLAFLVISGLGKPSTRSPELEIEPAVEQRLVPVIEPVRAPAAGQPEGAQAQSAVATAFVALSLVTLAALALRRLRV